MIDTRSPPLILTKDSTHMSLATICSRPVRTSARSVAAAPSPPPSRPTSAPAIRAVPEGTEARGFVLYVGIDEAKAADAGTDLGRVVEALQALAAELAPAPRPTPPSPSPRSAPAAATSTSCASPCRTRPRSPSTARRRAGRAAPSRRGGVVVDISRKRVLLDGEAAALTYKEFELLQYLVLREGRTIERHELIASLWASAATTRPRTSARSTCTCVACARSSAPTRTSCARCAASATGSTATPTSRSARRRRRRPTCTSRWLSSDAYRKPHPPVTRCRGAMTLVDRLRAAGSVFAEDEAALLEAEATDAAQLEAMTARRLAGEPLEVIVGWAEFAGRRLAVAPGVFIPRRRTEFLATVAASLLRPGDSVLDLCCGVGAIGSALQSAEEIRLFASDIDPIAVDCARQNLSGATVVAGDLFEALPADLRLTSSRPTRRTCRPTRCG